MFLSDVSIKRPVFATMMMLALVVPASAIHQRPNTGAPYVYLVAGDAVAESDVTLGANDDAQELVEVLSGVNEGDQVIVGNVGMLGKGMRVQVLGTEGPGRTGAPGARGVRGRSGGPEQPGPSPGPGPNGPGRTRGPQANVGPEASASPNPNR